MTGSTRRRAVTRLLGFAPLLIASSSVALAVAAPREWEEHGRELTVLSLIGVGLVVSSAVQCPAPRPRWMEVVALLGPLSLIGPWGAADDRLGIAFSSATILAQPEHWSLGLMVGVAAVAVASVLPAVVVLSERLHRSRPMLTAAVVVQMLATIVSLLEVDGLALLTGLAWMYGRPPTIIPSNETLTVMDRLLGAEVAVPSVLRVSASGCVCLLALGWLARGKRAERMNDT